MPQRPLDSGSFGSADLDARRLLFPPLVPRLPYSRQHRKQLLRERQRRDAPPPRLGWHSLGDFTPGFPLRLEESQPRCSVSQTFSLLIAMTLMGTALPLLLMPRLETARAKPVLIKSSKPVVALRRAIIAEESDTNHRAINPHSQAMGYAQILPENLPHWSREVFGREVSQAEFLGDPALQVQLIEYMLGKYLQEELQRSGGNEAIAIRKVASRWYSGRADLYDSPRPQFYKGVRYPSVKDYTQAVLKKYRQERRKAAS